MVSEDVRSVIAVLEDMKGKMHDDYAVETLKMACSNLSSLAEQVHMLEGIPLAERAA